MLPRCEFNLRFSDVMTIAPQMFARVMALPAATREDLLEFIGGATVDETKVAELIDEAFARVTQDPFASTVPN